MTLRTKFFAFFALLAVIPLVGVGALGYVRSIRAVESLVATQVEQIATVASRELENRYALHVANLLLLAGNAETQSLFDARAGGDPAAIAAAEAAAAAYFDEAWQVFGREYEWIELQDAGGRTVRRMGGYETTPVVLPGEAGSTRTAPWMTISEPVLDAERVHELGTVTAVVIPDAMLPFEQLERRFGASGYSVVFDRTSGRVLYHPRHAYAQRTIDELAGPSGWDIPTAVFEEPEGSFTYRETDSSRVAWFRSLDAPPWTVLASGSVDEFGAPFADSRTVNLLLVLLLTVAVWIAYTVLARRATRSLAALTTAADRVGAGDFEPPLPAVAQDEVGRLTTAFRLMVAKVRESLQQMETSRQMAAVGAFASQISHEIRNPLTSLQMNLQGLQRDVQSGRIPADLARPVELCLNEVHRLDGVVSGVLSLAHPRHAPVTPCSLHRVIHDALDVLRAQLTAGNVTVLTDFAAGKDTILADTEALRSVLLNLCLNGAEAMPSGGTLRVTTESTDEAGHRRVIRVRVEDDGVGVAAEIRDEIFKPFFSTKKDGTGIGLSLAARIVEEHRGTLMLAEPAYSTHGSAFVIELPLASKEHSP